jgi:tetratricopeptide (TPR) repeat protein
VTLAQEAATRAEHLRALGRFDDAERILRTALNDEPSDGGLLLALAAVLLSVRRFDEGLAVAAAAVAAAPDDERGHRIRALLLAGQGRHREAVESGYRAVTLAPSSPTAALAYSMLLQGAGRLADAAQVARRAVELAPQSADAHFQLADVTSDQGDRATARQAYAETLRLNPEHAAARHDLAVLDARAHRPGRALGGLVTAGRLDPTMPEVLGTVTAVCWQLSWRIRMLYFAGTLVTIGATGGEPGPTWGARLAAVGVLAVTFALGWWTARPLPRGTWPVARAAIRADRPLTLTYLTLGLCTLLFAVVAVSGVGLVASAVWLALGFLGLMALAVRLFRRGPRAARGSGQVRPGS